MKDFSRSEEPTGVDECKAMNEDQQLRVQAFLDGELPDDEARDVASLLARDSEATALFNELRYTRKAFKGSDTAVRLPESREFYWSKIERAIERSDRVPGREKSGSVFQVLRRLIVPAGAGAAIVIAIAATLNSGNWSIATRPDIEMTIADSSAFTYQDFSSGTTLVWVSYPAESEFAEPIAN